MPEFVAHHSIEDVCIFLRSLQLPPVLVLPAPEPDDPWLGIFSADQPLAVPLSAQFGLCLDVESTPPGWTLHVFEQGVQSLKFDSPPRPLSKEEARTRAGTLTEMLNRPKLRTRLARFLSRPDITVEKLGEAIGLPFCERSFDDLRQSLPDNQCLLVEGDKINGKLAGQGAGPGYLNVADLIEDTCKKLLERQQFEAAVKLLRGYDVHLWSADGAIRCTAPKGAVTAGLIAAIGQHKQSLLPHLPSQPA